MFICERDEFGWTTYIDYGTARRAGWSEELENRIRVLKPRWDFTFDKDILKATPTFDTAVSELTHEVWEIEEKYLTSVVVELLRDLGYTVIEPEDPRIVRDQIQRYYD